MAGACTRFRFRFRQADKTFRFFDLPVEIQTKIISYLPFQDGIKLFHVSNQFWDITGYSIYIYKMVYKYRMILNQTFTDYREDRFMQIIFNKDRKCIEAYSCFISLDNTEPPVDVSKTKLLKCLDFSIAVDSKTHDIVYEVYKKKIFSVAEVIERERDMVRIDDRNKISDIQYNVRDSKMSIQHERLWCCAYYYSSLQIIMLGSENPELTKYVHVEIKNKVPALVKFMRPGIFYSYHRNNYFVISHSAARDCNANFGVYLKEFSLQSSSDGYKYKIGEFGKIPNLTELPDKDFALPGNVSLSNVRPQDIPQTYKFKQDGLRGWYFCIHEGPPPLDIYNDVIIFDSNTIGLLRVVRGNGMREFIMMLRVDDLIHGR